MKAIVDEGRGARPGLRVSEVGSVTIETAGALVALTIFFSMLVSGLSLFGAELTLTSMARDAARSASIQNDRGGAEASLERLFRDVDGVQYALASGEGFVSVTLTRKVRVLRIPGGFSLRAQASALQESAW